LWVEGGGLVIASVLAIANIGLWIVTNKAANATRQSVTNADTNFRTDERAWIGVGIGGTVTFTIDQPFLVPVKTSNSGKTPAQDVHGNVVVGVFEKGRALNFDYSSGHHNANYGIRSGTLFPGGFVEESFQGVRTGDNGKPETILLHKASYDAVQGGQAFVIVHGIIFYNDIFGIEHWTTFCRYVTNPSFIDKQCTEHNATDTNR
jgi:hypothetical protein